MKRIIIAAFALFLVLAAAQAREVKVRNVKGLRRAIELASEGDTIRMHKGFYRFREKQSCPHRG